MRFSQHAALPLALLLGAGLLLLPACAHPGGEDGSGSSGGSRNLITSDEVDLDAVSDVYQVVQRHRPMWLRGRGTLGPPEVFVDGRRRGDGSLSILRELRASDFLQIRFLSPADATSQYGTGFASGIIDVEMRRR